LQKILKIERNGTYKIASPSGSRRGDKGMEEQAGADIILFGGFRFDRRRGRLSRQNEDGRFVPVAVGSRALEILGLLVDRHGDVVSRDEILNTVWPGVVEGANVTVQISALRRALDNGLSEGSIIQTIPGRGYRFAATVTHTMAEIRSVASPMASDAALGIDRGYSCVEPRISVVVLPFASLSADPEQEYFTDAITDDLTTDLSRIADSFVIARTTAFTYKGKAVDVRQVARELGVRYVIEGSVRRMGERVQVNVQLIDGESGSHVWVDRFDKDRRDLAEAQSEITGRLARTLDVELVRDAGRRIEQERRVDPDARDLIVRARSLFNQGISPAVHRQALDLLDRALMLDPRSVDARILIANILVSLIGDAQSSSIEDDQALAEKLIREALERDPSRAQARAVIGLLRRVQGRWAESQVEYETAVALDPNNASAVHGLGQIMLGQGKLEAAIPYLEKRIRLDPRNPLNLVCYNFLGRCRLCLGRIDQAVDFFRKARAIDPAVWHVHLLLAGALGLRGDIDEAKSEIAEALKLKPEASSIARWRAIQVSQEWGHPRFQALFENNLYAGLRRAGFPQE
jgi:TolB-like protein/DNA-binding winged helix-turn-helix (wHTH) protein/Tfp pilus assembly protein PilF